MEIGITIGIVVLGTAAGFLSSPEPEAGAKRGQNAPSIAVPAAVPPIAATGSEICRQWESFGNSAPEWSQRCTFTMQGSGGRYSLTFAGDYGEDWLLVGVAMVQKLEELDQRMTPRGVTVRVAFAGQATRGNAPPFTVRMADVTRCRGESGESSRRLCLVETMVSAMKRSTTVRE